MISKEHLERFLKANGIEPSAADGDIKSILLAARWNKDDVETAIAILRENPETNKQHIESMNKLFRTDERLKPETISALLGVDVDLIDEDIADRLRRRKPALSLPTFMIMVGIAIIIGMLSLLASMYHMKVGPFHQTVQLYK